MKINYSRVILKISGEQFESERERIDFHLYNEIAQKLIKLRQTGKFDLAIVVGGGNIFRGRQVEGLEVDRTVADSMGMLSTIINGLALQEAIERNGQDSRLMTSVEMRALAEPYIRRKAIRHMEKGRIVIIAGGLGKPFFTTDTAVAHYAAELKADLILKASTIDGVYNADPKKDKNAKKYKKITFDEAIVKKLQVMDSTAFTLCRDNKIPVVVFDTQKLNDLPEFFKGKSFGTLIEV